MQIKNKYNMTIEENIFLAKRNIVDYIYKSAKLEGIAVTYPQTEIIYDGMSVQGMKINDINIIVNLKNAWHFILDNIDYAPIDFRFISQIHKEIANSNVILYPGEIRKFPVSMGGTKWKPTMPIKSLIEENINEINSIGNATDRAITMMLYLMRCQMFTDGNKRTATLVANQILIQNGAGIITIPEESLEEFKNKLVNYYETNDMKEIKEFIYKNCIDGLRVNLDIEETVENIFNNYIETNDLDSLDEDDYDNIYDEICDILNISDEDNDIKDIIIEVLDEKYQNFNEKDIEIKIREYKY